MPEIAPTAPAPARAATTAAIVHAELIEKVKVIKSRRGGSIADVLTNYGGPGIDEEFRRVVAEMNAQLGIEG